MKVKFVPQNVEFSIEPGQCVMHVAQDHDLYIKSVCKGVPSCAECRVRVIDGEHNVLPPGSEELSLIGTGHFIDRRRLSCQLKCFGDITIDMTEQLAKQSGAISGQKKRKLAIKDDRIEDAVAIRANLPEDETSGEPGSEAPRPARGPGGPSRRPAQQQQERKARPAGAPASGGAPRPNADRSGLPREVGAAKAPRPQQPPRAAAPAGVEGEKSDKPRRKRRRGGGGGRGGGERGPAGGGGGSSPSAPKPRGPGPTGAPN